MKREQVIGKIFEGDARTVLKEMEDDSVDYVLTSPPYNQKKSIGAGGADLYDHYNDKVDDADYYQFLCDMIDGLLRVTKKYVFFNIMYGTNNRNAVFSLMGKYANNMKDVLIWKKPIQPAMCHNVLTHNYEYIFVLGKNTENRTYEVDFGGQGKYTTCFDEVTNNAVNSQRFKCDGNLAIMSIQLAKRVISTFTKEGDLVLDPFVGSGTTLVACKQLNRAWTGIELDRSMIKTTQKRLDDTPKPLF